jgi:hypothetical protein
MRDFLLREFSPRKQREARKGRRFQSLVTSSPASEDWANRAPASKKAVALAGFSEVPPAFGLRPTLRRFELRHEARSPKATGTGRHDLLLSSEAGEKLASLPRLHAAVDIANCPLRA